MKKIFLVLIALVFYSTSVVAVEKFKEGKTKIKSKLSGQLSFLILFIAIIGLIIYSVNDLLFN